MEKETHGIVGYIHHYILNLKGRHLLTPEELEQIGHKFTHFRLSWGGEYFDFSYDMIAFHPVEGKSSLLGGDRVSIKPYTILEFIELAKDANYLIVFSLPGGLQFTPLSNMEYKYMTKQDIDMFDFVKIYQYIDYTELLVQLEKRGYVTTRPSQNLIATIDKRFELTPKATQVLPLFQQYGGYFYEADCLGTTLNEHLTKHMEMLWRMTDKK
jgi:hypothetical protein